MKKEDIIATLKAGGIEKAFGVPLARLSKRDLAELLEQREKGAPKHLSPSQVEMYRRCPMQYYYRYIQKMVLPPRSVMTLGSSVDAAVNANYQTKLAGRGLEPLDVLSDVFREAMKERESETLWDEPKEQLEAEGLGMVKEHLEVIAPATEPVEVQRELIVEFTDLPFSFLGYADLIAERDGRPLIIDLKVSGASVPEGAAQVHPQLTAYYAAQLATGDEVETVALDVLVRPKKRTPPRAQTVIGTRTRKDAERYWKTCKVIYNAIVNGIFYPAPRATGNRPNWVCTEAYCGYFAICHEQF